MTMDHHEMSKTPVAKRVSFDDIDEDVLETFIKVKSKYITDGQVQYPVGSRNVKTSSQKSSLYLLLQAVFLKSF